MMQSCNIYGQKYFTIDPKDETIEPISICLVLRQLFGEICRRNTKSFFESARKVGRAVKT